MSVCTHRHKALLRCPPAPGCTPPPPRPHTHTYTNPSNLPGKPGPKENVWCAANCSLQSWLQLSIAPTHTRPRQQGKVFPYKSCTCSHTNICTHMLHHARQWPWMLVDPSLHQHKVFHSFTLAPILSMFVRGSRGKVKSMCSGVRQSLTPTPPTCVIMDNLIPPSLSFLLCKIVMVTPV